jgi:hypothetical protein
LIHRKIQVSQANEQDKGEQDLGRERFPHEAIATGDLAEMVRKVQNVAK